MNPDKSLGVTRPSQDSLPDPQTSSVPRVDTPHTPRGPGTRVVVPRTRGRTGAPSWTRGSRTNDTPDSTPICTPVPRQESRGEWSSTQPGHPKTTQTQILPVTTPLLVSVPSLPWELPLGTISRSADSRDGYRPTSGPHGPQTQEVYGNHRPLGSGHPSPTSGSLPFLPGRGDLGLYGLLDGQGRASEPPDLQLHPLYATTSLRGSSHASTGPARGPPERVDGPRQRERRQRGRQRERVTETERGEAETEKG